MLLGDTGFEPVSLTDRRRIGPPGPRKAYLGLRPTLVEQHAREQGERVLGKNLVGRWVLRDRQHVAHPATGSMSGTPTEGMPSPTDRTSVRP